MVLATDTSGTSQRQYAVWGSTDADDIEEYVNDIVPSYDGRGLVLDKISIDAIGGGNWEVTADYVHPDVSDDRPKLEVGEYKFSFDTGSQQIKRMVSIATTNSYAKSGETAEDFKGAIGVTTEEGQRRVDGVDIGLSALKFSIEKRQPKAVITLDYVKTLTDLAWHWNDDEWMGFDAGESLFTGATGQDSTESDPVVTYSFLASANATNLTVGEITSIAKRGHDYLWTFFEDIEGTTMTVKRPKFVYVEQVYYSADFRRLLI